MIGGARGRHSRSRSWQALALLVIVGCGGNTPATSVPNATTAAPSTSSSTPPPPPTSPAASTSTPTVASGPIGFTFLQIVEDPGPGLVEISYPHLVHPDATVATRVNDQIDAAIQDLIHGFQQMAAADGTSDTPSRLVVQAAPELLNEDVFSISGVTADFYGASGTGSTGRLGWVFALDGGSQMTAADFFTRGDLERLAEAARDHLIADVLGSELSITTPDGLAANPANFDAVWLTSTGIGVGFDQFQVAGADAGNPAILIPYPELQDVIDATGILALLQDGPTLPEL